MRHVVDDRASELYLREKVAGPERYAHTRNREMTELRKENNRLFGRLLNIYEVSTPSTCSLLRNDSYAHACRLC